jgi:predicted enzyme related to lactoylglutathione lyase
MTLRFEIFPDDLDATVDFYLRVLRFRLIADRRDEPSPYVSLQRGSVRVGAARRAVVPDARVARRPPAGVELVLEVDDVVAERDQITAAGWPITEDLRDRPWGLRDFRVLDPAGYYLRITHRDGRVPGLRGAGGTEDLVGDIVSSSGSGFGLVSGHCDVDDAGGVECFLGAADGQSGEQDGVFVAVSGG